MVVVVGMVQQLDQVLRHQRHSMGHLQQQELELVVVAEIAVAAEQVVAVDIAEQVQEVQH